MVKIKVRTGVKEMDAFLNKMDAFLNKMEALSFEMTWTRCCKCCQKI